MDTKYISFLDLLGTKAVSRNDGDKYFDIIIYFSKALKNSLVGSCKAYCFSDCAYMESETLLDLVNSLVQLRERLLQENIFFNAAICNGQLNPHRYSGKDNLNGFLFNDKTISKVYSLQSSFNGIGILIEDSLAQEILNTKGKNAEVKKYIAENFFLPDIEHPHEIKKFYDILLFNKQDLIDSSTTPSTLDYYWEYCIEQYIHSNIKSKRYGRYYISLIINLIASLDLSSDYFNTGNDKKLYCEHRLINYLMYLGDKNKYLLNKVIGIEYILFYLINKIYIDNDYKTSFHTKEVVKNIYNLHIFDQYMDNSMSIPDIIFNKPSKNCFLEDYYRIIKENSYE